ncbi:MAG TPA: cyclodeaminase/cyclohydrolase family protein [Phycisphaerae bacterium]|nr:cyclodeaminase/cyclohydrolase family protein [Phycisphaerae bacterium]HRW53070.1 cyclodeaminase/cyclohydrolase family protein [Phycisphaerae bacterium]
MATRQQTIADFLEQLASRSPTPGGGGASALLGAVAAALCGMVARLNDKKSGEAGPLHDVIDKADTLCRELEILADEDVNAFNQLMACWKLPEDAPDRSARLETATAHATEAPLAIMRTALSVMRLAVEGLTLSKKNCISDAGVAGLAAHACVEGARLNVMINLPGLSNQDVAREFRTQADEIRAEAARLATQVNDRITELYDA